MKLGRNCGNGNIVDLESWFQYAPPKKGAAQWKDGRSAKELARFLMQDYPNLPEQLVVALQGLTGNDSCFTWAGEYETSFAKHGLGTGTGRNHDAILYNQDLFVGIEAKADEPFGDKYVGEEYDAASENKKKRIRGLIEMIFGGQVAEHINIRYQLLTACGGTLLEAYEKGVQQALFLIIVFKKNGCYTEDNDTQNQSDLGVFLDKVGAILLQNGYYSVPARFAEKHGIKFYLKKIEIYI